MKSQCWSSSFMVLSLSVSYCRGKLPVPFMLVSTAREQKSYRGKLCMREGAPREREREKERKEEEEGE